MGLSLWYKRLRHSHGYGVHSPFAYRMVREVINPSRRYGYYMYDTVSALHTHHICASQLRLIFRLVAEFNPSTLSIAAGDPDDHRALRHTALMAAPGAEIISDGRADLLICADRYSHCIDARDAIFIDRRNPAFTTMAAAMPHGQIYRSARSAIIVTRPHLPLQTLEIRF